MSWLAAAATRCRVRGRPRAREWPGGGRVGVV